MQGGTGIEIEIAKSYYVKQWNECKPNKTLWKYCKRYFILMNAYKGTILKMFHLNGHIIGFHSADSKLYCIYMILKWTVSAEEVSYELSHH